MVVPGGIMGGRDTLGGVGLSKGGGVGGGCEESPVVHHEVPVDVLCGP